MVGGVVGLELGPGREGGLNDLAIILAFGVA
jgi:hypothetical protein